MGGFKVDAKEARLKEIRREIGLLLDEANLLAHDAAAEERQWIDAMWDLLAALDARDALGSRPSPSDG
jgi:hypothetical protein